MRKWWHFAAVAAGALACRASLVRADMQLALRNTAHTSLLHQVVTAGDWCKLRAELADVYFVNAAIADREGQSEQVAADQDSRSDEDYYIDELGFCNDPSCPCHDSVIGTDRADQDYAADNLGAERNDAESGDELFSEDYYSDFNDEYFEEFAAETQSDDAEVIDGDSRHTGDEIAQELNEQTNPDAFGWQEDEPDADAQLNDEPLRYEDQLDEEDWIHRNLINDPYPAQQEEAAEAEDPEAVRAEEADADAPAWFDYGALTGDEPSEAGTAADQMDLREAYGEEPFIGDEAIERSEQPLDPSHVDDYLEYSFDTADEVDMPTGDAWDEHYEQGWQEENEAADQWAEPEPYLYDDYGIDPEQEALDAAAGDSADTLNDYEQTLEQDLYGSHEETLDGQGRIEDQATSDDALLSDAIAEEQIDETGRSREEMAWDAPYEDSYGQSDADADDQAGEPDQQEFDGDWYDDYSDAWHSEYGEADGQFDQAQDVPVETTDPEQIDDFAWEASEAGRTETPAGIADEEMFSTDSADRRETWDAEQDTMGEEQDWYLYDYEYGIEDETTEPMDQNAEQRQGDARMTFNALQGIRLSTLLMHAARAMEQIENAVRSVPVDRYLGNMTSDQQADGEIEALLEDGGELSCRYCELRSWEREAEAAQD